MTAYGWCEGTTLEANLLEWVAGTQRKRRTLNKLVARQRLVMTFTFFSMFFGAGNLIFPPFVGAQAGSATMPAAIGFIVSAVGLPILGVLAVTFAGGFDKLAGRVSPNLPCSSAWRSCSPSAPVLRFRVRPPPHSK